MCTISICVHLHTPWQRPFSEQRLLLSATYLRQPVCSKYASNEVFLDYQLLALMKFAYFKGRRKNRQQQFLRLFAVVHSEGCSGTHRLSSNRRSIDTSVAWQVRTKGQTRVRLLVQKISFFLTILVTKEEFQVSNSKQKLCNCNVFRSVHQLMS